MSVAWVDLDTGERWIERPDLAEAFEHAVEVWKLAHVTDLRSPHSFGPAPAPPWPARVVLTENPAGLSSLAADRTSIDLADNRAGAAVRSKALEARQSKAVWTRLARIAGVHTEERAWRIGARGEELVGKQLAKLGPRWHVLHSIPVSGNADIDHLATVLPVSSR